MRELQTDRTSVRREGDSKTEFYHYLTLKTALTTRRPVERQPQQSNRQNTAATFTSAYRPGDNGHTLMFNCPISLRDLIKAGDQSAPGDRRRTSSDECSFNHNCNMFPVNPSGRCPQSFGIACVDVSKTCWLQIFSRLTNVKHQNHIYVLSWAH